MSGFLGWPHGAGDGWDLLTPDQQQTLLDIEDCSHDWMSRPESDTWECLFCGAER